MFIFFLLLLLCLDCLGVGLSPTLIAGALVFGMYILFRSDLCMGATDDEVSMLPGATADLQSRLPIFVFVPGWLPANLIFMLIFMFIFFLHLLLLLCLLFIF